MSESILQKRIAKYLDNTGCNWCHVPNGMTSSPIAARRMKAEGLKTGVPDVIIFDPVKGFNGFGLELKWGKNYMKPHQKEWLANLKECGWYVACTRDLNSSLFLIDAYLEGQHEELPKLEKSFYFILETEKGQV